MTRRFCCNRPGVPAVDRRQFLAGGRRFARCRCRAISAEWTCPPKKAWKTVLDMTDPMASKGLVYSTDGWKTEKNFDVRSDGLLFRVSRILVEVAK